MHYISFFLTQNIVWGAFKYVKNSIREKWFEVLNGLLEPFSSFFAFLEFLTQWKCNKSNSFIIRCIIRFLILNSLKNEFIWWKNKFGVLGVFIITINNFILKRIKKRKMVKIHICKQFFQTSGVINQFKVQQNHLNNHCY